jgi:hypothetical protein
VKLLAQDSNTQQLTKVHFDQNVPFPFQDDFSGGTIHGADAKPAAPNAKEIVEIQDNVSFLTTKISSGAQSNVVVGSRVASGSNPVSCPTTNSTQPGAASGGSEDPASNGPAGGAVGGPISK